MEPQVVHHEIAPVFDERSRVLVLGTMPSPVSRAKGFYYAHPQNRFWRVLAALFQESVPEGNEKRAAFALRHRIALWDTIASCSIVGASDASIADVVPNDLTRITEIAPIEAVFTTGSKATTLYRRYGAALLPGVFHKGLPSTSSANARMRLDDLIEAYRPLLDALEASSSTGSRTAL
ncbi:DNA-deoxyinosine glycosylase [Eggerthella sp. YY7918]|uniref:DNA-deoxyinosine glycosylase n=1 Tax=Eggerthella sp. (strain YY7918) TaxID=502558 RepID=UPI00021712CD|nr:DNA-deoxyinosine glycosylase [Eggerthella sp. YY7918]BAK44210.1 G:T/U mismatch-specific DNA glycosylase [Eggerthella sp. YY7918]